MKSGIPPVELIGRYEAASFTVTKKVNAMIREHLREDLTMEQFSVLRYIRGRERCTSTELADAFCVGKSAITSIITRLVGKKLIWREADPVDRRVLGLVCTPEGEARLDEMEVIIQQWIGGFLGHFTQEEVESFIGMFEKLAAVIRDEEKGSAKS